jgi:cytoskeleton protein RodZ
MEKKRSASFGKYLKTVRLEKGIKLSEIFRQTRISRITLELIEEEDHARLPAEVFVIGFLKAYAEVVGADGNIAVEGFLESRRLWDENIRLGTDDTGSRSKFRERMLTFLGILVVIIAVAVFALQATKPAITNQQAEPAKTPEPSVTKEVAEVVKEEAKPAQDTTQTEQSKPAQDTTQTEQAMPVEPVEVEQAGENTVVQPDVRTEAVVPDNIEPRVKQRISVQVVEDTWLKVIVDSLSTSEYSLEPGDTIELDADKGFNLLIGNATGIRLTFNGQPVPVSGKSGQVVTIQLP